jgi:phosphomannomutase
MSTVDYRCPGQKHPISRAAHLGRLAAFYPPCRQCPHRDDTGTLSPRQIEQLQEVRASHRPVALFHEEGAGGVYLNDLAPAAARDIAAAFGQLFSKAGPTAPNPSVILAGDGRAISAELSAAASEGLRLGGCNVIDVGPATAACLAFAVDHLSAAGGMLVGNPSDKPHRVGLQFWAAEAMPLSTGGSLEPVVQLYQHGVDRPARRFGDLHRAAAEEPYLAAFAECYHALRPLRIVIASASGPLVTYLQRLAATVACQVIPCRVAPGELPEQIRADAGHFAACVDGDGETCRVLDERGQPVPADRLLLLLAEQACSTAALGCADPALQRNSPPGAAVLQSLDDRPAAIVLEASTPAAIGRRIEELGGRAVMGGTSRAEMAAAMRKQGAILGGGPTGRFWHLVAGVPLPDALMTITRLLMLLSRSDEPFSAVLDREVPPG